MHNPLAGHYSRFRVGERLLLTGHAHQAWPDVGFEAQQQAWLDAAELVDHKWERAEAEAARVREGFARLLGDSPRQIALGQNTHELLVRWLSALPLAERPGILTTDGEFQSVRRQVERLGEAGLRVTTVASRPAESLAERLAAAVDDTTACVIVSSVFFDTAEIVPGLDVVARACERTGAELLVDAYHHLNVVPFDVRALGLESAFVTGGGYKYCQLGEGNCFLRVPADRRLRPVVTGWHASPDGLADPGGRPTRYAEGGAALAGATYDPTAHYRAAAVFAFHRERGLTAGVLRSTSQRQIGVLQAAFEALDVPPERARIAPLAAERRGGFLAVLTRDAPALAGRLRRLGVFADARGPFLRLGPAPYLRDDQLTSAVDTLGVALGRR